jgi:hypothetical protein
LRLALLIGFNFVFTSFYGQDSLNICNCFKAPIDCVPEVSRRKIVSNDTMIAHHSYCYEIWSDDEKGRAVVLTFLCDKKPTDSFYLSFFDPRTLGAKSQTWYDTSGKFIYFVASKNNIIEECFWYHYPINNKNYDYTIGYREGELFKELYTWDDYGASWKKKITITANEITTVISTDDRDSYGNYIYLKSTVPNKAGKVE